MTKKSRSVVREMLQDELAGAQSALRLAQTELDAAKAKFNSTLAVQEQIKLIISKLPERKRVSKPKLAES